MPGNVVVTVKVRVVVFVEVLVVVVLVLVVVVVVVVVSGLPFSSHSMTLPSLAQGTSDASAQSFAPTRSCRHKGGPNPSHRNCALLNLAVGFRHVSLSQLHLKS